MISTIISDLGKVILWFDNKIFFRKMTDYCGCSEETIKDVVHKNSELIRLYDTGKMTPQEFYRHAIAKLGAKISYEDFFAAYCDVFSLNLPVLNLFIRMKGKYRLILLSNTDSVRFPYIKNKYPEILFFDDYVLSYEIGLMKPDPQIYLETLKINASKAAECVFIDDMEENIESAGALGIKTVLYKPDTDLEKELRSLGISF